MTLVGPSFLFTSTSAFVNAFQGFHFPNSGTEGRFFGREGRVVLQDRLTLHSLALLSDLSGLMDTVHHRTRLNECKMSNQQYIWSSTAALPALLPAGRCRGDPGDPLDDFRNRSVSLS